VLTVDVEGEDVPLIREFEKDANFKPSFLRFAAAHPYAPPLKRTACCACTRA